MSATPTSIIVCMHELPLENAGGGVLLREILRYLARDRRVLAVYPAYPHQAAKVAELGQSLPAESIIPLPLPVAPDWAKPSFTIRRLLSRRPGSVVTLAHSAMRRPLADLAAAHPDALWLAVSPFALAYVPPAIPPGRIALYFTNVDEDIVIHATGTLRQRVEGKLEQLRVRHWVAAASRRAGRLAAITKSNASILSDKLGRAVHHVPPLMAPRPINRTRVEPRLALITTNYTYPHNRVSMEWFLREVWPRTDVSLRLEISGLDDGHGTLARLLSTVPRTRYLGFLSKLDLEAAFARCSVVVNPTISGSGFQIKMLDALARGLPLATTTQANPLGDVIESSDDSQEMARLVGRLASTTSSSHFDYDQFFEVAGAAWHLFTGASVE